MFAKSKHFSFFENSQEQINSNWNKREKPYDYLSIGTFRLDYEYNIVRVSNFKPVTFLESSFYMLVFR